MKWFVAILLLLVLGVLGPAVALAAVTPEREQPRREEVRQPADNDLACGFFRRIFGRGRACGRGHRIGKAGC